MSYKQSILPFAIAIIGHAALIGLLLWNFEFDKTGKKVQFLDAPITAKLVTAPEKSKKDAQSLKRKTPPVDQEKIKKQQQEEEQQRKEAQQKAEREKQQAAEQQKKQLQEQQRKAKELEAKKIKDEADRKKKAEAERKKKVEADKKRKAEEERKKKLAAEKKRKADAERKRKAEERKKQQEIADLEASLDDELFEADLGDVRQSQVIAEVDKLTAAIESKIFRNWDKPNFEASCSIRIIMGPGGVVLESNALEGDAKYCETGKQAITRSSPLPSSKDPQVMAELKVLKITFDPSKKK